jgi:hypothetical protein
MKKLAELLNEESVATEVKLPYAASAIDMAALDCPDVKRVAGLLVGFATAFDKEGLFAEASALDSVLTKLADNDDAYAVVPKKEKRTPVPPDRESLGPLGHALQTRYSPDLPGVSMERVEDGVYRDPVTNKTYDFHKGFVLDDGTVYAGGSVSAQTPTGGEKKQPHKEPLSIK